MEHKTLVKHDFFTTHLVDLVLSFPQMKHSLAPYSLIHVQNLKLQTQSRKDEVLICGPSDLYHGVKPSVFLFLNTLKSETFPFYWRDVYLVSEVETVIL